MWIPCTFQVQSIDILVLSIFHWQPVACNIIDALCVALLVMEICIEILFQHMGTLSSYFQSKRNKLYFALTVCQTVGTAAGVFGSYTQISALRFVGILRVLNVMVFAAEKFHIFRTLLARTLTQTVIMMIPVFVQIMLHIAVVLLYIYVVVGTELFVDPDPEQWGKDRCNAPKQFLSDPYALFCDAQMASITLFQILVTNDWHKIMYQAMEITENEFNCLYFITFFICGPLVIVNLVCVSPSDLHGFCFFLCF